MLHIDSFPEMCEKNEDNNTERSVNDINDINENINIFRYKSQSIIHIEIGILIISLMPSTVISLRLHEVLFNLPFMVDVRGPVCKVFVVQKVSEFI
jgi:limonene-1,2-epoxide hydrolase